MTPRDVRQITALQLGRFWPDPVDLLGGTPFLPDMRTEPEPWRGRRIDFQRMDVSDDIRSGTVFMMGDSQVASLSANDVSPFALNMGISGEPIRNLCHRLDEITGMRRGGAGVLLTGVNDLVQERAALQGDADGGTLRMRETVRYEFTRLEQWLTGKWVVCHILPVNESMPGAAGVFNADIVHVNAHIDSLFTLRADVRIVDAAPELAPNGVLLPEYTLDGIHLSAAGRVILRRHIRAALADLGI